MTNEMVTVGRILGAHGIKGQLKVETESDNPLRFVEGGLLFVQKLQKEMKIAAVQKHNGILLLTLESIADRTAAEALTGTLLRVDKKAVPPLPEGQYYYFQIKGMKVYDYASKEPLGVVSEVLEYTANDVFNVKREGKSDLLLPALKSVVKKLDIENNYMEVIVPEGLED